MCIVASTGYGTNCPFVILYLNEYYILYCEFIDRVFEKITNERDK